MKKEVVAPIQRRPLLNSEAATVPFVGIRRVRVQLLRLHRQLKKLAPRVPDPLHQLRVHAVVHHLKKAPLAAGARYRGHRRLSEAFVAGEQLLQANHRDVDVLLERIE